jgi:hypothetical protein
VVGGVSATVFVVNYSLTVCLSVIHTNIQFSDEYLAIQGSSSPSECAFSQGALTDTKQRNRFSPAMFEALQILKSAYWNGHIKASEQSEAYITAFIDEQDGRSNLKEVA